MYVAHVAPSFDLPDEAVQDLGHLADTACVNSDSPILVVKKKVEVVNLLPALLQSYEFESP